MVTVRCERCGVDYPRGAGHRCGALPGVNDNEIAVVRFDEREWMRNYMRDYMKAWRRRQREKRRGT